MARVPAVLLTVTTLVAVSCSPPADDSSRTAGRETSAASSLAPSVDPTAAERPRPLRGKTVVIDPGHQLGNARFPAKINRLVPAGGFRKACNSTGTSTVGGYPEATFNWRVAKRLAKKLRARGATVRLTRHSNRRDRWGPCVNKRGRSGNRIGADLLLSIHADGAAGTGRGFHVIAPTNRKPWTSDIFRPSKRLGKKMRKGLRSKGFRASTYVGGRGLVYRADLGTLNLSNVPAVMVECGNMRNARDARVMTSRKGRDRYARGLLRGVSAFLR